MWVALIPLFRISIQEQTLSRNAWLFFITGMVYHLILLQWLLANIFWAGGWAIVGYFAMCVALSLYWAVLGYAWARIRGALPGVAGLVAIVPLWVAMEFLQARLFTGFGWSALGYSQTGNMMVLQWASIGGLGLLGALIVLINLLLTCTIHLHGKQRLLAGLISMGILIATHTGGWFMVGTPSVETDYKPLQVGLYQSNYSQEMKWDRDYAQHMVDKAGDFTRRLTTHTPRPDFVVWPEALVMQHYETPEILGSFKQAATDAQVHLFTGVSRDSYNSSVLLNPAGDVVDVYDKVHLAPFGEYVPLEPLLPFLRQAVPGGGLKHGEAQKIMNVGGWHMGPLICFEVLFSPMAAHLRSEGADFLTVITNLAWFGGSNAILQELEIARMRAVETRLPLIHVANTGVSGVFDPWGRFIPINLIWDEHVKAWRAWNPAEILPQRLVMQRAAGVIPLPSKISHPLPWGATVFNWLMLGLCMVMVLNCVRLHYRSHPKILPENERQKKQKRRN